MSMYERGDRVRVCGDGPIGTVTYVMLRDEITGHIYVEIEMDEFPGFLMQPEITVTLHLDAETVVQLSDKDLGKMLVREAAHPGLTPFHEHELLSEQQERNRERRVGEWAEVEAFDLTDEEAGA